MRRLGRWQQLLVDALAEREKVAVQAVVEQHLGRPASRAELNAAQRAAHLLAGRGGAAISYVTAPAGLRRSRLAVSRPRDWPSAWLYQDDEEAAQSNVVRWEEPAAPVSEPPLRFGRWQQVIVDALAEHEVVGLRAVVEGHLRRRAERAESTAAQRAARLLASSGQVQIAHVRVPAAKGRRGAELLVVARAEVDPTGMSREAVQAAAVRLVAAADRTSEALDEIVVAVRGAADQVADVDLHTVNNDAAGQAAQVLASPLLRLTQLRQSLLMRRPRP